MLRCWFGSAFLCTEFLSGESGLCSLSFVLRGMAALVLCGRVWLPLKGLKQQQSIPGVLSGSGHSWLTAGAHWLSVSLQSGVGQQWQLPSNSTLVLYATWTGCFLGGNIVNDLNSCSGRFSRMKNHLISLDNKVLLPSNACMCNWNAASQEVFQLGSLPSLFLVFLMQWNNPMDFLQRGVYWVWYQRVRPASGSAGQVMKKLVNFGRNMVNDTYTLKIRTRVECAWIKQQRQQSSLVHFNSLAFLVCLVLNHCSLCYSFLFNTTVAPWKAHYPQGLSLLNNSAWIYHSKCCESTMIRSQFWPYFSLITLQKKKKKK